MPCVARLYWRPHEIRDGKLWCPISEAFMSTSFANSRFLAPFPSSGASDCLFADFADMLALADPAELFALADARYAVMVVKQSHVSRETFKMDGQRQSLLLAEKLVKRRAVELGASSEPTANARDGQHAAWARPSCVLLAGRGEIGELPVEWNYLVGVTTAHVAPKLLHFTLGTHGTRPLRSAVVGYVAR